MLLGEAREQFGVERLYVWDRVVLRQPPVLFAGGLQALLDYLVAVHLTGTSGPAR